MPGLEYVLVLALTFGAGVSVGKSNECNNTKKVVVVKHKPWYALHTRFHFHTNKCKHKKKKWMKHNTRRWRKHFRIYDPHPYHKRS